MSKQQRKRPYQKPEVRQIPLKPEEAVLGACKSTNHAGPGRPLCSNLACHGIGS
jgi:hypothetical protein